MEKEVAAFIPITDFEFNLSSGEAAIIAEVTKAAINAACYRQNIPFKWGLLRNNPARLFSKSDIIRYKFIRERRNENLIKYVSVSKSMAILPALEPTSLLHEPRQLPPQTELLIF